MSLHAIYRSPGRAREEKQVALARIEKCKAELHGLCARSAFRRMWVAWSSVCRAAPQTLQTTGSLLTIANDLVRYKWPLYVHHQAGNLTGDARKIAQYVEAKYGSVGDASKDGK